MPTYKRTAETPGMAELTNGSLSEILPGQTVSTYKILAEGWEKTDSDPLAQITGDAHVLTASEPGFVLQTVNLNASVFDVVATAMVEIYPNEQSANPFVLAANHARQFANDGEIEQLWINFLAAGTVIINELTE